MAWVTPKTNWQSSDIFYPDSDYTRIKGNIEYLKEFSEKLYAPFSVKEMEEVQMTGFPYVEFFNNIVDNVETLAEKTFTPSGYQEMKSYEENQPGWDETDLNIIESNLSMMYSGMNGQWNILPKLSFEIGGSEF